jgi:hypothetical protein
VTTGNPNAVGPVGKRQFYLFFTASYNIFYITPPCPGPTTDGGGDILAHMANNPQCILDCTTLPGPTKELNPALYIPAYPKIYLEFGEGILTISKPGSAGWYLLIVSMQQSQ